MSIAGRRRAIIAAQQTGGGLPSEYQRVEYLENTAITADGYQNRFDSGELATYQTELLMDVAWLEGTTKNIISCGPNKSGNVNTLGIICFSSSVTIGFAWFGQWVIGIAIDNDFHTYLLSNEKMQVDGVDKQFTPVSSGNTGRNIKLFSEARATSQGWNACKQRIRYARIKQNGVLTSELIPCYHKTTQEIGFYDTVKKSFVSKGGTGTITKGPDVT